MAHVSAVRGRIAYLALGAIAIAVYFFLRGRTQGIAYEVIGGGAVLAVWFGGRHNFKNGGRRAWELFAVGLAFEVAGDATYTVYDFLGRTVPTPSVADLLYLAGYPILAAGVVVMLRDLGDRMSRTAALDAVIAFVAVTTLQWIYVLAADLHAHVSTSARLVDMAYPCADVLLLGAIMQLLIAPTPRTVSYRLLTLSVALWVVGDEIYLLRPDSYTAGSWLDAVWLASYVVWGAAALQPAGPGLHFQDRALVPRLTGARLALLAAALVAVPVALAVEAVRHGRPAHVLAAAIGMGLIAVLVLARLAELLRAEIEARHEAESMQQLLAAQNEGLRNLDRLKDEFVASVSHELRTPLTSISGYTDLLEEGAGRTLDQEQAGYLRVISRNTERLLTLVNDLLFAAGLQQGGLALRRELIDATVLARDSVESARPRAKHVELTLETNGPAFVHGDAGRLGQLLDNLVSNAIKFTPDGGTVTVRTFSGGDEVLIEVTDSGIGIPGAEQERLFDRFFRSSNAVAQAIPGTGLGLYITRAIVHAHGGEIAVDSEEGEGTRFRITLPAAVAALDARG